MKGSDTVTSYPGSSNTRVRDAFVGTNISSTSDIVLFNKNPYTEPGSAIDLGRFQVKVSGVMVGATSSTVSRSISTYFTPSANLATFLSAFKGKVTTSAVLTTQGGSPLQSNSFNISSVSINDLKVTAETALASYQLNGNPNVYSVKGNLTIENCVNNTFVLSGVKTLVVEGNLTIKCNIGYQSNDTTSSWAFITKNGDIKIYNGNGTPNVGAVTNIAGVYVAIKGTTGGNITYDGANTTTSILRLDGSMYGNAKPLFDSRLYVRGTNAYDILTTGVILSYSNRALVNPPPLLSNFLGNYSVTRVTR